MVHKNVKSTNVLLWQFPSPSDATQEAGNVWIKLSDFAISEVSTNLTEIVGYSLAGTPGFMAPELFGGNMVISSEKVI